MDYDYIMPDYYDDSCVVFNKAFNTSIKKDSWKYKHLVNPHNLQPLMFGAYDNEKLVGVNCFMPMTFQFNNEKYKIAQSCDSAVDPDYRNKGVFTNIIMYAEQQLAELGYDALIGFPNDNSYPGFKKMGWEKVGNIKKLFLPVNISNIIKKPIFKQISFLSKIIDWAIWSKINYVATKSKLSIVLQPRITIEDYEKYINKEYFFPCVDEDELNWKCKDLFKKYVVFLGEKNVGEVVVFGNPYKNDVKRANIVFSFFSNYDEKIVEQAFAKVLVQVGKNFDLICTWDSLGYSESAALKKLGFIRNYKHKDGSPFIIKVLNSDETVKNNLLDPLKWAPRQFDTDTIIEL